MASTSSQALTQLLVRICKSRDQTTVEFPLTCPGTELILHLRIRVSRSNNEVGTLNSFIGAASD